MSSNDHIVSRFFTGTVFRPFRHLALLLAVALITLSFLWYLPVLQVPSYYKVYAWIFYFLVVGGIIYLNMYVAVPRLLLKNKLLKYAWVLVGSTAVALLSVVFVQYVWLSMRFSPGSSDGERMSINIASGMLVFVFLFLGTTTLLLVKRRVVSDLEKSELEASLLESELRLLKNQVNPHFLFNMLNNANVLLRKDKKQASELLFKLRDLLRYQIHDSNSRDEVPLSSEIDFLNDYLNLEKIRRDTFEYTISADEKCRKKKVPPLLFVVFVENAVKHNADHENLSYVHLSFHTKGNVLEFVCENSKSGSPLPPGEVGGLGLKNIRRRLELLYPGIHSLTIEEESLKYTVKLMLAL